MTVTYTYNRDKDIWCLLNKGKSSNNSSQATKVYQELVEMYGDDPSEAETSQFIDSYLEKNGIDPDDIAKVYQNDWDSIADEFHKRAENIFQTTLPNDITGYLTVNNRSPYKIPENFFYVSLHKPTARAVTMHELWHFYTWYGLGTDQEEKLGKEMYNNLKEALTVLLNVECVDLFPEREMDKGYPQHEDLRKRILEQWSQNKDAVALWEFIKQG